ncbi:MAG: response regulator transcription factor [Opitutaceae bacterium]
MKRVVVVEDELFVADYVAEILMRVGCEVVGSARSATTAVPIIRDRKPSLVILDLRLKQESGLSVLRQLKQELPKTRWLIISGHLRPAVVAECVRLGANGIFSKSDSGYLALRDAIEAVLSGGRYFSPSLIFAMADALALSEPLGLSETEEQVLLGTIAFENHKDIATRLGVDPGSITKALTRIREKFHLAPHATVHEVVTVAKEMGISSAQ